MQIVALRQDRLEKSAAVSTDLKPQDIRNFITRFKSQLPGLERLEQNQQALRGVAELLQVFANNDSNLVQFFFQLRSYLRNHKKT